MKYFGPSTGETGAAGIGDMVVGTSFSYDPEEEGWSIEGEPVYGVFIIKGDDIEYIETPSV